MWHDVPKGTGGHVSAHRGPCGPLGAWVPLRRSRRRTAALERHVRSCMQPACEPARRPGRRPLPRAWHGMAPEWRMIKKRGAHRRPSPTDAQCVPPGRECRCSATAFRDAPASSLRDDCGAERRGTGGRLKPADMSPHARARVCVRTCVHPLVWMHGGALHHMCAGMADAGTCGPEVHLCMCGDRRVTTYGARGRDRPNLWFGGSVPLVRPLA